MKLEINQLSFSYGTKPILKDINLIAQQGECICLLGPNGIGKTTLFKCILNLLKPSCGTITIDGKDVSSLSPKQLAKYITYIPQSHHPIYHFSVIDMIVMARSHQLGYLASPGSKDYAHAMGILERLSISHLAHRLYHQLSGGQQQLVLIGRALAQECPIILMDEPIANLDYGNGLKMMQRIQKLAREGFLIIQSIHNPEYAYRYSDRIWSIAADATLTCGSPKELFQKDWIQSLYQIDVNIYSLEEDGARVCLPTRLDDIF